MKAVAGHSHLTRRGSTYYFRRRVPLALRSAFPFEAWIESLHTTDFEEAKRLVRQRSVEIDARIRAAEARANAAPSPPLRLDEASGLAAGWLKDRLDADAEWRLLKGPDWWRNQETVLLEERAAAGSQLANGLWRCVGKDADDVLAKAGRFYGKEDPSRRLMAGALLEAQVAYYEAVEARQRGEVVSAPSVPAMPLSASSGPPSGHTVEDLISAYTADKAKAHGEGVVLKRYGHIFAALRELLGPQRVVSTLTRADGRAVRDFLATVPKHAGKKYPKLSLREAVGAGERDSAPTLSPKSVASYMQNLNAMMNWAAAEGWIDRNPFSGLVGKAEAQADRRAFSPDELAQLFATLVPLRDQRPWQFWIPALALHTGARLNELAQLRVEDVVEVDGTPCIRISPYTAEGARSDDKRVKTTGSKRTVPLHADLLALGFVEFGTPSWAPNEENQLREAYFTLNTRLEAEREQEAEERSQSTVGRLEIEVRQGLKLNPDRVRELIASGELRPEDADVAFAIQDRYEDNQYQQLQRARANIAWQQSQADRVRALARDRRSEAEESVARNIRIRILSGELSGPAATRTVRQAFASGGMSVSSYERLLQEARQVPLDGNLAERAGAASEERSLRRTIETGYGLAGTPGHISQGDWTRKSEAALEAFYSNLRQGERPMNALLSAHSALGVPQAVSRQAARSARADALNNPEGPDPLLE